MFRIVAAYLEITLFRRGPESIPASRPLLILTIVVDVVLVNLASMAFGVDLAYHLLIYFIGLTMVLSVTSLLLSALRVPERFLPTATALVGADCVLSVCLLVIALTGPDWSTVEGIEDAPVALRFYQLLVLWGYGIMGFVLKRAGRLNLLGTMGVVLSIYILTQGAISLIPVETR